MAESSQLSYQTTMPEYPDVSYQAWQSLYGRPGMSGTRLENALYAWGRSHPNYETWRTNQLDDYNAKMTAYNTWLSSGAGKRASAESGNYNPSYFQGAGDPTASPLNYEDVNPGSGFNEVAQGVSGLISFISALQGMALTSEQIKGVALKNEGTSIENKYLEQLLSGKASSLGYQNDWQALRNSVELYSRFADSPELWKNGVFSPYGGMSYDLRGTEKGLTFQRAVQDMDFVKAGISLRNSQIEMNRWNAKERKFYTEQMQSIQKDILEGNLLYLNGEINYQQIDQRLRKAGAIAGIATDAVNSISNVIKSVTPIFKPLPDFRFGTSWVGRSRSYNRGY